MKPWQQSLRDFVDTRSETGHVVIAQLAGEFLLSHRAELASDADAHMRKRVTNEIRSYLHAGAFAAQEQMLFAGMDLPAFIAVRHDELGEVTYVRTGNATWADLEAGRQERVNNVAAAQAKLDAYDESLIRLSPIMSNNPGVTVNGAIQILAQGAAA